MPAGEPDTIYYRPEPVERGGKQRRKVKTMTKMTKKNSTKKVSKKGNGKGEKVVEKKRRGRTPKAPDAPYTIPDPTKLLRQYPEATEQTLKDIAADKTLNRSDLTPLGAQIALRLAHLGLMTVDTTARNAKDRVYKATKKTTMRALAAALKAHPAVA